MLTWKATFDKLSVLRKATNLRFWRLITLMLSVSQWAKGPIQHFAEGLELLRSLIVNTIVILTCVLLVAFVVSQMRGSPIIVEPIRVPKKLYEAGYTPPVVASRLVDKINLISEEANRTDIVLSESLTANTFVGQFPPKLKIDVLETGISFASLVSILKQYLNYKATLVSGEIIQLPMDRGFQLHLRLNDSVALSSQVKVESRLEDLFYDGALNILDSSKPNTLSFYLYKKDPKSLLERMSRYARGGSDERAWVYNVWGLTLLKTASYISDFDNAITKFKEATKYHNHRIAAFNNLGYAYVAKDAFVNPGFFAQVNKDDHKKAAEAFEQSLKINCGGFKQYWFFGGRECNNYQFAAVAYENWGRSCLRLENYICAKQKFHESLRLNPDNRRLEFELRILQNPTSIP